MQYLLVSINNIKIKWSPIVSQRAITLNKVETSSSSDAEDQMLSNIFNAKRDNSQFIFSKNNLNTYRIAQFIRRTLSEFIFDNLNVSLSSNKCKRALMYNAEAKVKNEINSKTSISCNDDDYSRKEVSMAESFTECHTKKVKGKKKQHSYKCVLCEKRSVYLSGQALKF